MLESESSALPFGDSPSYVLKYTTYNVLCKPFAQALVYYITLETKKQVFFLEYSAIKIEMFNSTLPLCSGILLCTSGI